MIKNRSLNHALLLLLSILAVTSSGSGQRRPKIDRSKNVEAVWAREELYWRLVRAGDVEKYRELWDEGFRGWPCKNQHTATKAEIGNWVRDIRDQHAKFSYSLFREGSADFGDIVVIYYQTPMVYEFPDGRTEGKDHIYKFTHTWRKTGRTWLIIGGMCGELPKA